MISSVPSYDEELLNSAYANIGLIADKGWAFHQDDPFRKLNHTLWVQNCKLTAKYRENGNYQPRCVRNTIPGSWLAQYGNYEYNEDRERMYKPGDNTPVVRQPDLYNGDVTEPWMLEEVEEHLARLNSRTSLPLADELSTYLRSSATDRQDLPRKLTVRETGRIVQPKWNTVSRKRYSTLGEVLAAKASNGRDSMSWAPYTTNMDESYHKNVDPEDYIKYPPLRYTVDNMAEMQLQIHVTSDAVRDLWNPLKSPQQHQQQQLRQQQKHFQYSQRPRQHMQCGQQQQHHVHCSKQQLHLQCSMLHQTHAMRPGRQSACSESIGIMRQLPPPMLSAEVPEFFPKGPMCRSRVHQEQPVPLQFFPSSAERSYQDELFPYNRGHVPGSGNFYQSVSIPVPSVPIQQVSNTSSLTRPSHQWIQRPCPAVHVQMPICPQAHQSLCTSVHSVCPAIIQRRVDMHDKTGGNIAPLSGLASVPIPVYQRPPELYNDPSQRRNKNQGVDFNNLILLTKNAMKAKRNQSKNRQQSPSFILEARQPNLKSETDVLQWLEKGYQNKAKDIVAVNILVSDFRRFEAKCDDENTVALEQTTEDMNRNAKDISSIVTDKSPEKLSDADRSIDQPTKRRLYRDVLTNSSSTGIALENVFDKRYDELERQAMEQYRTSEECLALRYQELERQAMEQYRNCESGAGSTSNNQSQNSSPATPSKGKRRDQSKSVTVEKECVGGQKCSGFGHCSPIKDSPSANEKGTPTRQSITILRPKNKPATSEFYRPVIVTKSLTTLNQRFTRDSKNTSRGASGDKIDRTVQASSKRHLILMSPSKHESEARPTKTSNLQGMYAFRSMNTHVSESYRKPEVTKTGGGDEKITILRSSGSEGIRKQLFLVNEGLMDGSSESLGVRLLEPTEIDGPCIKMDVASNLKTRIIGDSSETSIATIIDAGREDEDGDEDSVSGIRRQPRQEHGKISNRITRNRKKHCKPHNIVTVEKPEFHRPVAPPTKSITFSPRNDKRKIELVDIVPPKSALTKVHREQKKSHLKGKLENIRCQKIWPLLHFPQITFQRPNYLIRTNYSCCYYSILGAASNIDFSIIFIHNDAHLFPKKCGLRTKEIFLQNEFYSPNVLMIQYHDIPLLKSHRLRSPSPFRVLPSWDNFEMNDLRETLRSGIAAKRIPTYHFRRINDYTQSYPAKLTLESVSEFYFDLSNLQLFPSVPFIPISGEDVHLYNRKDNIYFIITDLENFDYVLRSHEQCERKIDTAVTSP